MLMGWASAPAAASGHPVQALEWDKTVFRMSPIPPWMNKSLRKMIAQSRQRTLLDEEKQLHAHH